MIASPHAFRAFRDRWLTRRDELRRLHALVDGATPCDELLAELDGLARCTMGRKGVAQLENELAQERDDNARLYMKVENLRAEIAELEESDDANDSTRATKATTAKRISCLSKSASTRLIAGRLALEWDNCA